MFQAGNNEHAKADRSKPRIVKQQLIAALNEAADGGPTKLRKMVDAVIDKAMQGDVAAFNAIAERVEGKPPQELTSEITHNFVAWLPQQAETVEEWEQRYLPDGAQH